MTLDKFGAGCRCLLRARENAGQPFINDEVFIASRLDDFPDWAARPGAANSDRLITIAQELGLARSGRFARGYWELRESHERGEIVLVCPDELKPTRKPVDVETQPAGLLTNIEAAYLTLWMPTPDGSSDTVTIPREMVEGCKRPFAIILSVED